MKLEVSLATLALATIVSLPVAAHTTQYTTDLFGSLENPVNASPGVGVGLVTFDLDTVTMQVQTTFDGLLGNVTVSHIHCCIDAPGNVRVATTVPTFPDFPAGATFGSYDRTFDMTLAGSYNPDFIANNGGSVGSALNALVAGLDSGQAYLNIHTNSSRAARSEAFCSRCRSPAPTRSCLRASAWSESWPHADAGCERSAELKAGGPAPGVLRGSDRGGTSRRAERVRSWWRRARP